MSKLSWLLLLFTLTSCCRYWPLIDGPVLFDYSEKDISFNTEHLVDNDQFQIKPGGKLFIPNKCRSRKLGLLFARLELSIEKNPITDTLTLDLNQANVRLTDGKKVLIGSVERADRDVSESQLVIVGKKFYVRQGSLSSNTIEFDFPYPKDFDLTHFQPGITVDFVGFRAKGNHFFPTGKLKGSVQQ